MNNSGTTTIPIDHTSIRTKKISGISGSFETLEEAANLLVRELDELIPKLDIILKKVPPIDIISNSKETTETPLAEMIHLLTIKVNASAMRVKYLNKNLDL